jgi:pseudouridine kinase
MDIKCRIAGTTVMGSSNPGATVLSPGGVARNVAHNLARLGVGAALVSAVGRDAFGRQILAATAAAGVDMGGVLRAAGASGSYSAVLDAKGELVLGVAAMAVLEQLTPRRLSAQRKRLAAADLIVADSNLPIDTLDWLIDFAAARAEAGARDGVGAEGQPAQAPAGGRATAVCAVLQPGGGGSADGACDCRSGAPAAERAYGM